MRKDRGWFVPLGAAALDQGRYVTALWRFCARSISVALHTTRSLDVIREATLRQIYYTGVQALGVVSVLGVLVGAGLMLQTLSVLAGSGRLIGTLFDLVIVRQLGPLFTAVLVVQRSGSAICVELGTAKVRGEVELLEQMGIDPFRYLVVPRMIGVTSAVVCLTVLFDLVALMTGYWVANLVFGTAGFTFFVQVLERISIESVLSGLFKTIVFGMVVATLSTFHGLRCQSSHNEVPIACQQAMVNSLVICLIINTIVTIILFPTVRM